MTSNEHMQHSLPASGKYVPNSTLIARMAGYVRLIYNLAEDRGFADMYLQRSHIHPPLEASPMVCGMFATL